MLVRRWKPLGELTGRRQEAGIRISPKTLWESLQSHGKVTCQELHLALHNGLCMLWGLQIFHMAQQQSLPIEKRRPPATMRMHCTDKLQVLLECPQQLMGNSDTFGLQGAMIRFIIENARRCAWHVAKSDVSSGIGLCPVGLPRAIGWQYGNLP